MDAKDFIIAYRNASANGIPRDTRIHLAVFDAHSLALILEGKKTIDTRFSKIRQAPFDRIKAGDSVMLKLAGGPIVAVARAKRVFFYADLTRDQVQRLKESYNDLIQASREFWTNKKLAKYATFIQIAEVQPILPVRLRKKDRRGWVVYDELPHLEAVRTRRGGRFPTQEQFPNAR